MLPRCKRPTGINYLSNTWLKLARVYCDALLRTIHCLFSEKKKKSSKIIGLRILLYLVASTFCSHLLDCASDGFLSLCLLFLNQLLTWVKESPVILARFLFSAGEGYLF